MLKQACALALITIFVPLASFASNPGSSVKSCTTLLPVGYTFEISLTATVERAESGNSFEAVLSVSDNTGTEINMNKDTVQPFLECALPLIDGEPASV